MSQPVSPAFEAQVARIRASMTAGQVLQAEVASLQLLEKVPDCVPALIIVAECAAARDDQTRALSFWRKARVLRPEDEGLLYQEAFAALAQQDAGHADQVISAYWRSRHQLVAENWLLWGHAKQQLGHSQLALKAWFRAIDQAQRQGRWVNQATTAPHIQQAVLSAMHQLRAGKQALLQAVLEPIKREVGNAALIRIDRALAIYLGASQEGPIDPRQRPKFLYIPGLPDVPYHDPYLQPWARRVEEAFDVVRDEALTLLSDQGQFESFLTFGPGAKVSDYVGGDGAKPSWDAFFFYRHGQRYEANHARCRQTSQLLDSVDLCRIRGQAPEVCFSLLAPGSHIKPHYGVTNSRLVMHLPLKVPADCALNILGAGEHHWQEGKLMMFDDTFQHEAWNRSSEMRLILLMDCWNPYLTPEERLAITNLVECISDFENVF